MSCTLIKDKLTKDFVDKGAFNVGNNNITNKPLFEQLNSQYGKFFTDKFNLDTVTEPFSIVDNKAVANEEYMHELDRLISPEIVHDEQFKIDTTVEEGVEIPEEVTRIAATRRIEEHNNNIFKKLASFEKFSQNADYSEKIDSLTRDNITTTEDKIERMKKVFDAEVIVDADLQASGALLASTHPLVKRAGKPVIVINPDRLFADTVFHEFGHLYIDLLGGLQDPVVAQAVEQLKESTLWTEVANKYPELEGENLAKEVLATALGVKGNDIYNGNTEKESIWQQLKQLLFTLLKDIFGIGHEYDAIEKIASEMLSGQVRVNHTARYNTLIDQYSKMKLPENPTQEDAIGLLEWFRKNYTLDEETHVYKDKEGNPYPYSSSSYAKSLTRNNTNMMYKGDFDIEYNSLYKLTDKNYKTHLDAARLPYALDQALEAFFNGTVGDFTLINDDPYRTWYPHYSKIVTDPVMAMKVNKEILANLDAINEEAARVAENLKKAPIMGTKVHKAIEDYINEKTTEFPESIVDTDKGELLKTIKDIVDTGKANGSKFFTEQVLFSDAAQMPGTADLIEITKDGKFRIYDFKTTKSFKSGGYKKSDKQMYVNSGYLNQLIIYSTMLEEYNLKPADDFLNIISIRIDGSEFDMNDPDNGKITVKEIINKNLSPNNSEFTASFKDAKNHIIAKFASGDKMSEFQFQTEEVEINNLVESIQRGLIDYRKLTGKNGKFTGDQEALKNNRELHKLEQDIEKFIHKNNGKIIYQYIDNMRKALTNVLEQSIAYDSVLNAGYVQNMEYLLQASSFIDDVKSFVETSAEDFTLEENSKTELLMLLNETEEAITKVKRIHKTSSKHLAIKLLAKNSNIMEGVFAENYEIEGYKAGHTEKRDNDNYVYKKLRKNKTAISVKEHQFWEKLLGNNGYTDIRWFEYLMADPGMSKSMFVQTVKKILDKVDMDVRIDLDKSIPEIIRWHENLKFKKTGDPKEIWKKFLVTAKYKDLDGKPVSYTHASVIPEFTSEYREIMVMYGHKLEYLQREINKAYKKNDKQKIDDLKQKVEEFEQDRNTLLKTASSKKYVHPDFEKLTEDEKEALRFIHDKLEKSDDRLYNASSKKLVVKTYKNSGKIYNLPRVRMSASESRHDIKGAMSRYVSGIKDYWSPPADEDEFNTTSSERGEFDEFNTSSTDILGNPSYDVPVFYRNALEDPTLQSFDIPSLLAMNEETTIAYEHHKMVEADLFMITSALKNGKSLKTDSIVSGNVVDKLNDRLPKSLRSEDNLTLKAVQASIDNRFYKRSYAGTYSKWNYRSIKAAEALSKGTSMLLLAGNFRSATMTGIQGTIYRFIEGIAGEHFTLDDVKKGSEKAYSDLQNVLADTQKNFPTSKTNLLIRRFGLETQYKALVNKFVQDNFVTKNMDEATIFSITSVAETIVTANLMYTLTGNIKVMNSQGDFIDKDGKVVPKEKAMSLDEAYEVKDGVLELHKDVVFTEKNLHVEYKNTHVGERTVAATQIAAYIQSVYADLYGQYNPSMKSVAEMNVLGKMAMSMRKWLPRGMHRRWRGITNARTVTFDELRGEENIGKRFYSQDQTKFQEGYYATGVRYFFSVLKKMKEGQLGLSMANYSTASKDVKDGMTFHERANLKRLTAELILIGVSSLLAYAATALAKSMDDGDDDRSDDKLYYLAYIMERIKMESLTFIWLPELVDNLMNPAAAVNTIKRLSDLFENVFNFDIEDDGTINWAINDVYERGPRKGQYKIQKNVIGIIPGVKNINQAAGILGMDSPDSIKDSFEYLR